MGGLFTIEGVVLWDPTVAGAPNPRPVSPRPGPGSPPLRVVLITVLKQHPHRTSLQLVGVSLRHEGGFSQGRNPLYRPGPVTSAARCDHQGYGEFRNASPSRHHEQLHHQSPRPTPEHAPQIRVQLQTYPSRLVVSYVHVLAVEHLKARWKGITSINLHLRRVRRI